MPRFNHLHDIAAGMDDRGHQILDAYQGYLLDAAKQLAPVDLGDLRDSGVPAPGDGQFERKVAFTAEHARHQEYGTMYMPPQPFLRPARNSLAQPFKRDLKQVFGQ